MVPFTVTAILKSPPAFNNPPTLDALLAAAIYQQTLDVEKAHLDIPLSNLDGVWAGSSAIFDCDVIPRKHPVLKSIGGLLDNTTNMYKKNGRSKYVKIPKGNGPYQTVMNEITIWETEDDKDCMINFYGHGTLDKVIDLLRSEIMFVGARRGFGYGEVAEWRITETDTDCSLISKDGTPNRPIPVRVWADMGGNINEPTMVAAWAPPYWDKANTSMCVVPKKVWGREIRKKKIAFF